MTTPARKNAWRVVLSSGLTFNMIGDPCTAAEARAAARVIWPDAEVRP